MLRTKQNVLLNEQLSLQDLTEPDSKHDKFFRSMSGRFFTNHLVDLSCDKEELLFNRLDHVIYHEPGRVLFTRNTSLKKELFNPSNIDEFIRLYLESSTMHTYKNHVMLRQVLDAYFFLFMEPEGHDSAIVLENLLSLNYTKLKRGSDGLRMTSLDKAILADGYTGITEECYPEGKPAYRIINFHSQENSQFH